jgi:glutamine cyclotransferase
MKNILVACCLAYMITSVLIAKAIDIEEYPLIKSESYDLIIPSKKIKQIKLPKGYHEGLCLKENSMYINNGENKNTWLVDLESGKIIYEIKPVGTFSEGISYYKDNEYFFTDWDTKKLYLVHIKKNHMITEREFPLGSYPAGVVVAGKHIYVIIWMAGIKIEYYLLKMDLNVEIIQKFKIEDIPEPSQIAWDGKNLWVSSWLEKRVYRIDEKKMEITGYFNSEIEKTTGLAFDKGRFWVTGTSEDLYLIELS